MDYTRQPLLFQARKALRYCTLYGPRRTWAKVAAQRHLKRRFDRLPPSTPPAAHQSVGLIGCGNYAFSNIAYYLTRAKGRILGACMDVDAQRAASLSRAYHVPLHTTDADELLACDSIRLVYIASNHATHAEYAIEALGRGKDVYIEKPHVVDEDQLQRLVAAMRQSDGRVWLGFNRPGSPLGRRIVDAVARQAGPGMYNWFIAGHAIDPEHWYFHPREGGRVLGNLCHWTDFVFRLVDEPRFPIRITPTAADRSDVDIAVTYTFGDGTMAAITFSAKGHTFEGVKERFSGHRGDLLVTLDDFQRLTLEVGPRKQRVRQLVRDHGHRANIVAACDNALQQRPYDRALQLDRVANTAWLFLKTRQALDERRELLIEPCPFLSDRPERQRQSA